MHIMRHINVEAASCGIWQPLKWRGYFLLNKARTTAEERVRWPRFSLLQETFSSQRKRYCGK